jgi:hypothetical protein
LVCGCAAGGGPPQAREGRPAEPGRAFEGRVNEPGRAGEGRDAKLGVVLEGRAVELGLVPEGRRVEPGRALEGRPVEPGPALEGCPVEVDLAVKDRALEVGFAVKDRALEVRGRQRWAIVPVAGYGGEDPPQQPSGDDYQSRGGSVTHLLEPVPPQDPKPQSKASPSRRKHSGKHEPESHSARRGPGAAQLRSSRPRRRKGGGAIAR